MFQVSEHPPRPPRLADPADPADPAEGDQPLTCVQVACSTLVLIHSRLDVFSTASTTSLVAPLSCKPSVSKETEFPETVLQKPPRPTLVGSQRAFHPFLLSFYVSSRFLASPPRETVSCMKTTSLEESDIRTESGLRDVLGGVLRKLPRLPQLSPVGAPGSGCSDKRGDLPRVELMFACLGSCAEGVCSCPQRLVVAPPVPLLQPELLAAAQDVLLPWLSGHAGVLATPSQRRLAGLGRDTQHPAMDQQLDRSWFRPPELCPCGLAGSCSVAVSF